MKKIILSALFLIMAMSAVIAQEQCNFPMAVLMSDKPTISGTAKDLLKRRMSDIVLRNGVNVSLQNGQFAIAVDPILMESEHVASAPSRVVEVMEVQISVVDMYAQKQFDTYNLTLKGVGETEEKAALNAVKQLNMDNKELIDIITKSRETIMAYYDGQAENIIREARRYAAISQYDKAIFDLIQVPTCCKRYSEILATALEIYQEYLNYNCQWTLQEARNLWAAGQDQTTARYVVSLLNNIDPKSPCMAEVNELVKEMKKQVRSDIDFETREKYHDSIELQKMAIRSMEKVGVAYGNNQKPNTYLGVFR